MKKIALLRTSPALYRLALAWPAVEREMIVPAASPHADPWAAIRFDFTRLADLADTSPAATIAGFDRLKAHGVILPDGSLDPKVEKFFQAEGMAGFGIKVKAGKDKPKKDA
jgi:hypothetical protein